MKIEQDLEMLVIKTSQYPNNENREQSYQNTVSIHMRDKHHVIRAFIGQDNTIP
jgi:phosphoenolpyruvate-protein kinase (PTS system EI component)